MVEEAMVAEAGKGILVAVGAIAFITVVVIIKFIFSFTKKKVLSVVKDDIVPFIKEKKRDFDEDKILKLKNLLDNMHISLYSSTRFTPSLPLF